jgi:hypothetical protein
MQTEELIMAFSEEVKRDAFARSAGFCECTKSEHRHHFSKCFALLTTANLQFHHLTAPSDGGSDDLSNCGVVCHECHVGTNSYGRNL